MFHMFDIVSKARFHTNPVMQQEAEDAVNISFKRLVLKSQCCSNGFPAKSIYGKMRTVNERKRDIVIN